MRVRDYRENFVVIMPSEIKMVAGLVFYKTPYCDIVKLEYNLRDLVEIELGLR